LKRGRRKYSDEDQSFPSVWKHDKLEESDRGLGAGKRDWDSWFKVTIPNGKMYDKTWLIKSIQDLCSVPLNLVDFHYDKHRAR
ncbi:hypothetical protein Q0L96_14395, partial [Staphylococcus aureus]|nr:hypothetical protein [Staphylococcus aureus]